MAVGEAMKNSTDWQPIKTAPKDGSDILLWDGNAQAVAHWYDNGSEDGIWIPGFGAERWPNPSHWMSLPEIPE